jgi:membrane protein implicated in regulation of membrane protease activity
MRRWVFVGGVGVFCGLLLGWLLWSLTASAPAAVVVGSAVAAILLVLAWGGARHNETFRQTPDRAREAAEKRRRVQQAIEETRRQA